jgi:diguanylate cyclase (GGDEF)-like protein/PAS domain S-box-containing protein
MKINNILSIDAHLAQSQKVLSGNPVLNAISGEQINKDRPKGYILIIDDDEDFLSALKDLLEYEGHNRVVTTTDASFTNTITTESAPDIVLIDINLGKDNGLDLIQILKQIDPDIICIMMTAYLNTEYTVQAIRNGADDYMIKPMDTDHLLRSLDRFLEQQYLKREKRQSEQLSQALFNQTFQLIYLLDSEGTLIEINDTGLTFSGLSKEQIIGKPFWQTFKWDHSWAEINVTPKEHLKKLIENAGQGDFIRDVIDVLDTNNNRVVMDFSLKPILDDKKQIKMIISECRDITALKEAESQLEKLVHYDLLTGLPNRAYFNNRLEMALYRAERHNRSFAVMFVDIDRFKHVNDTLGHIAGDELLIQVAKRLLELVRAEDTVSRLSGDEFTIILNEITDSNPSEIIAKRVIECFSKPFTLTDQAVYISASAGVSLYPEDGKDIVTLLKNADAAMYNAKSHGKNNFKMFSEEMNKLNERRLALETGLHEALINGSLFLHYQPKLSLVNNAITGAEALSRWEHPEEGNISPAEFIPIAEECGLIIPIGQLILEEVCQQMMSWKQQGLPLTPVAINLSANQFRDQNLIKNIRFALEKTGLPAEYLELELTETLLMDNVEDNILVLKKLKEMGHKISIDDFGTGYSSLSYLKQLPVDTIKIDKSFIKNLNSNQDDRAIVNSIIFLAKNMGLKVIAEGVETEEQLKIVTNAGCDEAQGYLFSKPVSAKQFFKWTEERKKKGA